MKKYFLSLIFLLSLLSAFAKIDTVKATYTKRELVGLLKQKNGDPCTVRGSRRNLIPIGLQSKVCLESAVAVIEFSIAKAFKAGKVSTATPSIELQVGYFYDDLNRGNLSSQNVTLSLEVNSAKPKLKTFWLNKNVHELYVTVIALNGVPVSADWDLLELNVSIITTSYDPMPDPVAFTNLSHDPTIKNGNLNVTWDVIPGAETYELEWTYIAGMDAKTNETKFEPSDVVVKAPKDITLNGLTFRNNSSRVVLKANRFEIPLVYEHGYVLYRLRAISKRTHGGGIVEYKSNWSNGNNNSAINLDNWKTNNNDNFILFAGLDNFKNWQSSISFAEEGKTKTVVSYHDGSMRNRQAVTRINSDNRTIVGETLYDYAGRPTIQLLPVPIPLSTLTYQNDFNTTTTNPAFLKKEDYIITSPSGTCTTSVPSFDDSKLNSASNYYSSLNNFKTLAPSELPSKDKIINRDLIPSAEKYPFTQTQYTLDNTGRIDAQSGVGKTHILGSKHETKYAYSTPKSAELTRLFGTQVGNQSHYKKNVVTDPNGQISVSYLDLDGKVIATALTGQSPDNLDSLGGDKKRTIHEDVLKGNKTNTINAGGNEKIYSETITVTGDATPYGFKYGADAVAHQEICTLDATKNKAFDGALKATITLTDKCKTTLFAISDTSHAGSTGKTNKINLSKSITLDKGDYTLSKTLKINDKVLDKYWNDYLADSNLNCLKKEKEFVMEAANKVEAKVDCNFGCDECDDLVHKTSKTSRDYDLLVKLCNSVCGRLDINPCSASLDAMKGDMSTGGQYGQIRTEQASFPEKNPSLNSDGTVNQPKQTIVLNQTGITPVVDPSPFPLSIFNEKNGLANQTGIALTSAPSWKTPVMVVLHVGSTTYSDHLNKILWGNTPQNITDVTYELTDYYNEDGKLSTVKVEKTVTNGVANYTPQIDQSGITYFTNNCNGKKVCAIPVKNLMDFKEFEKLWKPSWGAFLVAFHPEFKYGLDCIHHLDLYAFNVQLGRCQTLSDAIAKDLVKPSVVTASNTTTKYYDPVISNKDPIKKFETKPSDKWITDYMTAKMALYSSDNKPVPQNLNMVQMATSMARCPAGPDYQDACSPAVTCINDALSNDENWLIYRNLYVGERLKVLRKRVNEIAATNDFYNGCIGHADFMQNEEAYAFLRPFFVSETKCYDVKDCPWYNPWCGTTKQICNTNPAVRYHFRTQNQACFQDNAAPYFTKQQRFFPTFSANKENGSGIPQNCSSSVTFTYKDVDGNEVTEYMAEPCSAAVATAIKQGIQNSQRNKYSECGLCPIAVDLQNFIVGLLDTKSDITNNPNRKALFYTYVSPTTNLPTPMPVNCSASILRIGGSIANVFKSSVATPTILADIKWNPMLSADKKSLSGELYFETQKLTLSLTLPAPSSALRSSINFDSIISLCCLDIDRRVGLNNKFLVKANYIDVRDNKLIKVVYLNGSITATGINTGNDIFDIDNCTFEPSCALSEKASAMVNFLNVLTLPIGTTKPSYLTPAIPTLFPLQLSSKDNLLLYGSTLRTMLGIPFTKDKAASDDIENAMPTWSATVSGNVVTGQINYSPTNPKVETIIVDFTNSGYTFNASNFVSFTNLETLAGMKLGQNLSGYKLKANVKYKTVFNGITSYHYAPVMITASFKLSLCSEVSKPTSVVPE